MLQSFYRQKLAEKGETMKGLKAIIFSVVLITATMGAGGTAFAAAPTAPARVDPLAYSAHTSIGFKFINDGIKYIQPNGQYLKNAWISVGNQKWCFDGNGNMLLGFYVIDNHLWGLTYEGTATLMDPAVPVAPANNITSAGVPVIAPVPVQPVPAQTTPVQPVPAKK